MINDCGQGNASTAISLYLQQSKICIPIIQFINAIYVYALDSHVKFINGRYMSFEYMFYEYIYQKFATTFLCIFYCYSYCTTRFHAIIVRYIEYRNRA